MKLNHLNLTVTDVPAAREFLETYFGMKCEGTRGNAFAVMFDDEGFILTLMKGKNVLYPSDFSCIHGWYFYCCRCAKYTGILLPAGNNV
ncbi:VOC family protein [Paenibacillus xylanilyticus]|uniref:VOC family protein n=1 Tax=Paenibacillus sp. 11B TaxID=3060965 RepID=UPI0028B019B2|nr:VOC family protein [Paenibacillus xylanilyticus]